MKSTAQSFFSDFWTFAWVSSHFCYTRLVGWRWYIAFCSQLSIWLIMFDQFYFESYLYYQIEPNAGDSIWVALSLFLYPVNFFYYFLFYTDTASTFSILIVYYLALSSLDKRRKKPSERKDSEMKRSYFTSNFFSRQQLLLVTVSCYLMFTMKLKFVMPFPFFFPFTNERHHVPGFER